MEQGSLDPPVVGIEGLEPVANEGALGVSTGGTAVFEGGDVVFAGVTADHVFVDQVEGADDAKLAAEEVLLGNHRAHLPAEGHVQEEGFQDIVPVVSHDDLIIPQFFRVLKDEFAPHPRTHETGVFPVGLAVGQGADIRFDPRVRESQSLQVCLELITLSAGKSQVDM